MLDGGVFLAQAKHICIKGTLETLRKQRRWKDKKENEEICKLNINDKCLSVTDGSKIIQLRASKWKEKNKSLEMQINA